MGEVRDGAMEQLIRGVENMKPNYDILVRFDEFNKMINIDT